MSKRKNKSTNGAMLDLWRPPAGAGDPMGCLATTYTFSPGLFDEQCLARFLEIESEPNREDLAFLLERETRLGGVYAGVLVDHTQAGVEHSLRWDVIPVRIRSGKQHAKISLLSWAQHVRIIVASANLTEPGYRSNFEVAGTIDLKPDGADQALLERTIAFMRRLLSFVPGVSDTSPTVRRATEFLVQVENHTKGWNTIRRGGTVRQQLAFTLPASETDVAQSSLDEAILGCRARGGSPHEAWVASPFFDFDVEASRVTAALCKLMARGRQREITFCVPTVGLEANSTVPRLAAPKALYTTPEAFHGIARVNTLPLADADKNLRPWHAKLLLFRADQYSAVLIGSSNFTCAGQGVGQYRNAEANLLYVAERVQYGRDLGQLEAIWPTTDPVENPDGAEWLGPNADRDEEEQATSLPLPVGFLAATYRAGDSRLVLVQVAPEHLPDDWQLLACGVHAIELANSISWNNSGRPESIQCSWLPVQPPEKLLVRWGEYEAFLPLNVQDIKELPPPSQLESMSADDMLLILAAADPSAAFRAWAKQQHPSGSFDTDLDSAIPVDMDPLRRYDLQATFLHRIRRRAGILAKLRANLERPVWGRQSLDWRLRGLVGIEPLALRLVKEFIAATAASDEALLTLADFLIVLREINYKPDGNSLSTSAFDNVYRPFLSELAGTLKVKVDEHLYRVSDDLKGFWERVVNKCQV
jgi:hypothetical protein